jgi:hypothetical protein
VRSVQLAGGAQQFEHTERLRFRSAEMVLASGMMSPMAGTLSARGISEGQTDNPL